MTQTVVTMAKTFKLIDSPSIYPPLYQYREKIKPIPIHYTKVQNCKITRTKLAMRGYKNFSKLSAAGPDTGLILRNVAKSCNLKFTHKLEFDPYLCEKSHLKDLCRVLQKKFKQVKEFNLVIRRMDYLNESNILTQEIPRLTRLKHFRIELPGTMNIDNQGVIKLAEMHGKLFSLKSLENVFPKIENISDWAFAYFSIHQRRLARVRKIKKDVLHYSIAKDDFDPDNRLLRGMKRTTFLEELFIKIGFSQGWFSMNTPVDETFTSFLRMTTRHINLKRMQIQLRNKPQIHDAIEIFAEILPALSKLKHLSLEFLNSRMSETEMVLFAQSLAHASQIEHIDFKVLQYPNVSEECIFYFVSVLSKHKNIKSFNAYFRRLTFSEEIMSELIGRTNSLPQIGCCKSTNSIHFFKHSQ